MSLLPFSDVDAIISRFLFIKENSDCYSPQQMNEHLRLVIASLQVETPLFCKINEDLHYAVVADAYDDYHLISGMELVNFSASVPSSESLREKMLSEGVPLIDKHALALAVESAFDESLRDAYDRIKWYTCILMGLRESSEIPVEALDCMYRKAHEAMMFHRWKIHIGKTSEEKILHSCLFKEHESRYRFLKKEKSRRD